MAVLMLYHSEHNCGEMYRIAELNLMMALIAAMTSMAGAGKIDARYVGDCN